MASIGIINMSGNIGSICNIINKAGGKAKLLNYPSELDEVSKVIIPGVGTFDNGMEYLEDNGWTSGLQKFRLNQNNTILGICLGMQLLTKSSEEGKKSGLGFINAHTIKFKVEEMDKNRTVPHMQWNKIEVKKTNPYLNIMETNQKFYFVHSYHITNCNHNEILTETFYGYKFVSGFIKNNILGLQFHPEKSHLFGLNFFKNFIER